MAGKKTRNEIWFHSIFGALVLAGTVALMLFGVNSSVSTSIGPLLAGLALSIHVFRFGLPWRWLTVLFLASFFVVGLLLGQPGLQWMGGFLAGAQFGVVWRLAAQKTTVKATWTVNGKGIETLSEARKTARQQLDLLDGERFHRLVVEHGPARFEVAGSLPSKLVCHRNGDAENDFSWAVLQNPGQPEDRSVEVPIGRIEGFIPSRYVNDVGTVDEALKEFLRDPATASLGPEWDTAEIAFDLRLSA